MKKAILFLFLGLTLTHCANQKNNTTKVEEEEWTPMPDSVIDRLIAEDKRKEKEKRDSIRRKILYDDSMRDVYWEDTARLAKNNRALQQASIFELGLFEYFSRHQRYPEEARKAGVSGSIMVRFRINADSTINFWVTDGGLGHGCEEEAERVLREAVRANMDRVIPEMHGMELAFYMFFEPKKNKK